MSELFYSSDLSTLVKDKEGHIIDDCSATEHEVNGERKRIQMWLLIKGLYVLQRLVRKLMLSTHNIHNRDWAQDK